MAEGLGQLAAHGLIEDAGRRSARVRTAASLADALDGAGFVQENTPETVEAKRGDLRAARPARRPDAILASSTSTIVASLFTEELTGRHRCLVAHPVNLPHLVPLVELVAAPWTAWRPSQAQGVLCGGRAGADRGQARSRASSSTGCRRAAVWRRSAWSRTGVTPQDLDKTLKNGLGLRWSFMGPFETIELNALGGIPDYCHRYGPSLAG